jgi:hypothetical protein
MHVGALHFAIPQTPESQSALVAQRLKGGHGAHGPPQSTVGSLASLTPLPHDAGTHRALWQISVIAQSVLGPEPLHCSQMPAAEHLPATEPTMHDAPV